MCLKNDYSRVWWHKALIPVLGRQRLVDLYEFKTSLVYVENFRSVNTVRPYLKKKKEGKKNICARMGVERSLSSENLGSICNKQ